ncbi:MAG TPA: ATP-binding protein, partial [Acidimicrobiia bacterium]
TGERSIAIDVREGAERITADPDHLSRVVINLLDNALKYAPSSPIEIVVQPQSGRFTISVIDHGSGIELAERDRAFERFTQLEPAQTRSQGGAGLGLSIVRGLVQAMGGTLDLVETAGGGATFVVTLPMVAAPERERAGLEVATAP